MHSRYQNLLPFYVKGLLSPEARAWLERHLDECATCREGVRQWRQVAEAVSAEAATWIPDLMPPPLKLPGDGAQLRLSDDGNLRDEGQYNQLRSVKEWPMVVRTVTHRRSPLSSWQRFTKLIAALLLIGLLGVAIVVLASILFGVKGSGQPGGPSIHNRAVTPTLIPSPTPTLTPTPMPPLPIGPDNADRMTQVAVLGQGYSTDVAWSPDGITLAVGTSTDVLLYDTAQLTTQPRRLGVSVGEVTSVAFSSDGMLLAIGGQLGTALWDMISGQARVLQRNEGSVQYVTFNPDGTRLVSRREDGMVRLWDTTTGQMWGGYGGGFLSIAFSPDGAVLAAGTDDEMVEIWDITTGQMLNMLKGHTSEVLDVAFSPDGTLLASGGDDNTVRLWDTETDEMLAVLEGHTQEVAILAFSPNGTLLASGSYDNTARLWDVPTGKLRTALEGHTGDVRTLVFSPDGAILASASSWEDNSLRLWDVASGEPLAVLEGCPRNAHRGEVSKVTFSPDGTRIASSCGDAGIMVWDVATRQPQSVGWQGDGGSVNSLAFSPDGTILAVGSGTGLMAPGTVQLWDVATGKERSTLRGHTSWVRSVAFSPDGTLLATGSGDGTARLWDATTGENEFILADSSQPGASTFSNSDDDGDVEFTGVSNTAAVWSVAFSPDGTKLAVGRGDPWVGPGSFQLYDVATGTLRLYIEPRASSGASLSLSVYGLAFSPDGTLIATANGNGSVTLWEVATGEERAILEPGSSWVGSVAFSPDGSLLATGGAWSDCDYGEVCAPDEGEMRLWDVATGEQLALVTGPLGGVSSVAFSPDGRIIAFAGGYEDGTVSLWDTTTRETLAVLERGYVSSLVFSADGTMLATGGSDNVVRLWGAASR